MPGARTPSGGVLGWLWRTVAAPVLDALAALPEFTGATKPTHVWWIPTGPLTTLPLHAATSADGSSVLDRVVSSYTYGECADAGPKGARRSGAPPAGRSASPPRHTRRRASPGGGPDAGEVGGAVATDVAHHPGGPGGDMGQRPRGAAPARLDPLRLPRRAEPGRTAQEPSVAARSCADRRGSRRTPEQLGRVRAARGLHDGGRGQSGPRRVGQPRRRSHVLRIPSRRRDPLAGARRTHRADLTGRVRQAPSAPEEQTTARAAARPSIWRRLLRWLPLVGAGPAAQQTARPSRPVDLDTRHSAHALRLALLSERARHPDHPSAWVPFVHYGV